MKVFSPFLNGNTTTSGSFNVPNHPGTGSIPNPLTGSLFHDDTDGILKIYTGTQWQVVGEQALPVEGPASADIEYLLVAGGGGAGGEHGGGGGAGGYLSSSLASIESGSSISVTVGGGGANGGYARPANPTHGSDGGDSSIASSTGTSFSTVTTVGGGGSGGRYYSGRAGGSGGGAGGEGTGGGSGTTGQGFDGGIGATGAPEYHGGGGGGAGQAGTDANNTGPITGDGGDGKQSSITGTSTYYAGGGGGCALFTSTGYGDGGQGGGGRGATNTALALSGTDNTGGGGGGANRYAASTNHQASSIGAGGNGGSGVAILAYPTSSISATGGVRTFFNDRVAHTFNSSGTFSVGGIKTYTHNTLDVFGDSSCIALYNLDGNANDTGGNYNGTASNVTYAQSYINNGGVFNGSNSQITTSLVTSNTQDFTWSVWVKDLTHNSSGTANTVLLDYKNDYKWFHLQSNGTIRGNVRGSDNVDVFVTTNVLTSSSWSHIVWVVSTTNGSTMYVNGVSVDTNSTAKSTRKNIDYGGGHWIGNNPADSSSGNYNLNGKLDQIRIFNKALSASEVATLYAE